MRYLGIRFSQIRLVKVASVVMEIRMGGILFVPCSPWLILAVLLSAHGKPLLQKWYLSPQPIRIYLIAKTQLNVEATTLYMLSHDVFPHEPDAADPSTLVGTDVQRKVIARCGDEAPICLMEACYEEFISRASEVRSDCISPFGATSVFHFEVDIIPIERPSLMS